jgi:hypothetical protein
MVGKTKFGRKIMAFVMLNTQKVRERAEEILKRIEDERTREIKEAAENRKNKKDPNKFIQKILGDKPEVWVAKMIDIKLDVKYAGQKSKLEDIVMLCKATKVLNMFISIEDLKVLEWDSTDKTVVEAKI